MQTVLLQDNIFKAMKWVSLHNGHSFQKGRADKEDVKLFLVEIQSCFEKFKHTDLAKCLFADLSK